MSHLYVTTSRNPSEQSRQLGEWLEILLDAMFENRGKRSVEEVVWRAKMHGRSRILFIYDRGGKPGEIAVFDVENGWLTPAIKVESVEMVASEGRAYKKPVRIHGQNAEALRKLLGFEPLEHEHTDFVELDAGANRLTFWHSQLQVGPTIAYALSEVRGASEAQEA